MRGAITRIAVALLTRRIPTSPNFLDDATPTEPRSAVASSGLQKFTEVDSSVHWSQKEISR
jgi:hypothetical protein